MNRPRLAQRPGTSSDNASRVRMSVLMGARTHIHSCLPTELVRLSAQTGHSQSLFALWLCCCGHRLDSSPFCRPWAGAATDRWNGNGIDRHKEAQVCMYMMAYTDGREKGEGGANARKAEVGTEYSTGGITGTFHHIRPVRQRGNKPWNEASAIRNQVKWQQTSSTESHEGLGKKGNDQKTGEIRQGEKA
jgi:hypothetical protein